MELTRHAGPLAESHDPVTVSVHHLLVVDQPDLLRRRDRRRFDLGQQSMPSE